MGCGFCQGSSRKRNSNLKLVKKIKNEKLIMTTKLVLLNYDYLISIFKYFNIRELAHISRVCWYYINKPRLFYDIAGSSELLSKFNSGNNNLDLSIRSKKKSQYKVSQRLSVINVEHHNEVCIFRNSIVIPKDNGTDKNHNESSIQNSSYQLSMKPVSTFGRCERTSENEDMFNGNCSILSKNTPKFSISLENTIRISNPFNYCEI